MKTYILFVMATISAFSIENINVSEVNSDLKITIYNSNIAFINDKREAKIPSGNFNLVYQNVPKNIISESVVPTFSKDVELYSQNYIYNTINQRSLLLDSLDKKVEFYKNNYLREENPELFSGVLLSLNPVIIKEDNSGKLYSLNNKNQVVFDKIPNNMITKPSLVWSINSDKEYNLNIDLKYLSTGISWNSNYVLDLVNKKELDLTGWITIKNNSGVDYYNADITCLAGEVNRINPSNYRNLQLMAEDVAMVKSMVRKKKVKEVSFSGYHIYKIPFKQDILNKQQKQIVFINKKKIKYNEVGESFNSNFNNYGKGRLEFFKVIKFNNEEGNNLGIPLPAGKIRLYSKDSSNETHFIGENSLSNTPIKEEIKIKVGKLFDVIGEKKISKYNVSKYRHQVETTYEIKNRGKEKVIIELNERIPVYGRKIRFKTSCSGICSYSEETAFNRIFTIKLDEGEVYEFKTEFNIEYN